MQTANRLKSFFSAMVLTFGFATATFAMSNSICGESSTRNDLAKGQVQQGKSVAVIAHRGYWQTEGSAQNSRTSLRKALELGIYGSEIDVWLTTDGGLMVNHDRDYDGVEIKSSTVKECKQLVLKNGEKMPTLRDLLKILKKSKSKTKLIIEIKGHGDDALDRKAATATVRLVKKMKLEDRVEYISFSDVACEQIISDDPNALVAALSGNKKPSLRKAKNYTGVDYHINVFRKNNDWINEAHSLGMTVNVWTVNNEKDIKEMQECGVDYLTTDKPVEAKALFSSPTH